MTMKNVVVTFFFVAMTITQCVLGIYMTIITSKGGGEIGPLDQKIHSYTQRPHALCTRSPTGAIDTSRRISLMRIFSTQ